VWRTIRIQLETREVIAIYFCAMCGATLDSTENPVIPRVVADRVGCDGGVLDCAVSDLGGAERDFSDRAVPLRC
jgi:hypothetical protein